MPKPPVSCFMRACNEERTIAAAISAALAAVDEVIIVDSGSTDGTVAVAEAAGARVVHEPWRGWGRQKRVGEDHCKHDYVLDLDADEIVTEELAAEIRALFANGPPPCPIYALKVTTVPPGGEHWARFNILWRNRLYDRRVVRAPDHEEWDQFTPPPGARIGKLKGELLHHSYRDLAHFVQKLNGRSTAQARKPPPKLLTARILFGLPVYFLRHFFLKGLYRGGRYGVILAGISAYGRWLRDAKAYENIVLAKKNGQL